MGRGGGQVVSVLAFYPDGPSSNPAHIYSFFCTICVRKRTKINKKRGRGWPILKKRDIFLDPQCLLSPGVKSTNEGYGRLLFSCFFEFCPSATSHLGQLFIHPKEKDPNILIED